MEVEQDERVQGGSGAGERGGGRFSLRERLGVGLGGDVDEIADLVLGEAGEAPELAGQVDRVLLFLAAEAAEAEELVDRALEVERPLAAARDPSAVMRRSQSEPIFTWVTSSASIQSSQK